MAVHNADIAAIFNEIADLLEIESANPFRVRAYRNHTRATDGHDTLEDMARAAATAGLDYPGDHRTFPPPGHGARPRSRAAGPADRRD